MSGQPPFYINLNGMLMDLVRPRVMGILNVTPDSFYAQSRQQTDDAIAARVRQILDEGGCMIDVGAYSSRPGADDVPEEEEMKRLGKALSLLRSIAPEAIVSVDTFRASVARRCVEEYGVQIINDISGGEMDEAMFDTVAQLQVPYILMHMRGTPKTMQEAPRYDDIMAEMLCYFAQKIETLREMGVKDIILDPGFGFGKTMQHNYEILRRLRDFQELGLPILVGISRKSMIYKLLESSPEESLNGTTVLNTLALMNGASILRVHDVKAAVEAVRLVEATRGNKTNNHNE